MRLSAALILLACMLFGRPLAAGGVKVEHFLTLEEVLNRARQVVVIQIIRLDNVYNSSACTGREEPFMRAFRAEALVEEVLDGDETLQGRRVWVHQPTPYVPCRWALVKELYEGSVGWARLQPGVRVLAYASNEEPITLADGSVHLDLLGTDESENRARVLQALRAPKAVPSTSALQSPAHPTREPASRPPPVEPSRSPTQPLPPSMTRLKRPPAAMGGGCCGCTTCPTGDTSTSFLWILVAAVGWSSWRITSKASEPFR